MHIGTQGVERSAASSNRSMNVWRVKYFENESKKFLCVFQITCFVICNGGEIFEEAFIAIYIR